ncbi:MAG: hypothetical protein COX70_05160 [Flavobacteriales bacterium CG_4_10_14_0_2_um_filter_32_8]|nr:MAG: hypothetical protein COX70_05160 [Flavobacteriales bacterium CG_4_10_14_0_2_um_filter_32_8]
MFKELKVIKLIVFAGLLFVILSKIDFSDNIIKELYTDKHSYYADDTIKVYSSTPFNFSFSRNISINDISGKKVSSTNIDLNNQNVDSNPLEDGLGFEKFINYQFSNNIKSGIYLIEDKYPIIIKSKHIVEITVVYPYANNNLYQAYNDLSVFSLNSKKSSLNRTAPIDVYSEGLIPFFNFLNSTYKVNFITDLDLEDINNFKNSKVLILYGKSTCWTPKMKDSFNTYVAQKGNVLLMSSYTLNNVCWYNKKDNQIIMYDDSSNAMKSWNNPPEKSIGVSYVNGGYSTDSSYQLVNSGHPILKGVANEFINIKANLYCSPPIKWYDDLPRIDIDSLGFYKGDIIAYGKATYLEDSKGIKGIFVLQPDSTSGKIVSLGTEDWCLKENIGENENLQKITKNSIEYLLK